MCEPKYCVNFLDTSTNKKRPIPFKIIDDNESDENSNSRSRNADSSNKVYVGPQKWCLPKKYKQEAETLYNFEVRPDDVWIISFPFSGAPLIQEMVWLLTHDCDVEKSLEEPLDMRSPFFEASLFLEDDVVLHIHKESSSPKECLHLLQRYTIPKWQVLRDTMKRRIIKTHLPICLLPRNIFKSNCKIIYLARNPKSVIQSAFHMDKYNHIDESYLSFFNDFQSNKQFWCPYWKHVQEAWEKSMSHNILFLFYEDIIKNVTTTINILCNFLGKTINEPDLLKLQEHLQIQAFKTSASLNQSALRNLFLVTYDEEFTENAEMKGYDTILNQEADMVNRKIDKWVQENLEGTTLEFSS